MDRLTDWSTQMIGFDKLTESQVANLTIGTQVFVKLSGRGWDEIDREEEGFYHIGRGRKLWSSEGEKFFFVYEMNIHNYEFEVYIPSMRYKIMNIVQDIKTVMHIYNVSFEEVIEKIKGAFNAS